MSNLEITVPENLDTKTKYLIVEFANALAEKLYRAQLKYGFRNDWSDSNWMEECRKQLRLHLAKGDPLDVAAYCAFLHYHGEHTDSRDFVLGLERQKAFSEKTFGPGSRHKGVLDHIRKELIEIENDPTDLFEWVDVYFLALDGAWRAGHTPEQIWQAIQTKQTKNETRNWPDWRNSDPDKAIEHDRSKD